MAELPDDVHAEIKRLCAEGDEHADEGAFGAALDVFRRAWALLPDPKHDWSAALWILAAIGDTEFLAENFAAAYEAFSRAVLCPDGFGNPFIHLRLGETSFELGMTEQAANELTRAYALEGAAIFESEDDKYFHFLKTQIKEPRGGWHS